MLHRLREQHWLWLIVVAGLLLRLAAMLAYGHVPEGDEIAYQSMASNLVHGQGLVDHMGNRAMYNMGYPAFILAPLFGLLGENLLWVRLAHVALGSISILLCYGIAREAGANRLGRLLAAGLWALYLPAAVHVVYLQKENLLTPLMLGGLWLALQLGRRASYPRAILCGLLFGLIALTGNAGLALAGAAGITIILTPARLGHTLRIAATALLTALLVITPWLLRNAEVLGTPLLNTNGGFNLYLGNNPAATGMFVSIADTPRGTSWAALRQQGEVQASATLRQDALDWIAADPVHFLSLAARKAAYFWTPPLAPGYRTSRTRRDAGTRRMAGAIPADPAGSHRQSPQPWPASAQDRTGWTEWPQYHIALDRHRQLHRRAYAVLRDIPLSRTHHAPSLCAGRRGDRTVRPALATTARAAGCPCLSPHRPDPAADIPIIHPHVTTTCLHCACSRRG